MKVFGRGRVSDLIGDFVIYRNLIPYDRRLPTLQKAQAAGLVPAGVIPRKSEQDYARVVLQILAAARRLEIPNLEIQRILFIGDTRLADALTFDQLCQLGRLSGAAFIGDETSSSPQVTVSDTASGQAIFFSNRWRTLLDEGEDGFRCFCERRGLIIDPGTVLVLDLDKTTVAARGRNAGVIDRARIQAIQITVANVLGDTFDLSVFKESYFTLNQQQYHAFIADNQDYLAYICLVIGSGLFRLSEIVGWIQSGKLTAFIPFLEQVNADQGKLPTALAEFHRDIYSRVRAGDPTPFKTFRYNEYLQTVQRMGQLPDSASLESRLSDEILITSEVYRFAQACLDRGALVFGLSDKPDEASLPTPELETQGYLPIHRMETHIAGEL